MKLSDEALNRLMNAFGDEGGDLLHDVAYEVQGFGAEAMIGILLRDPERRREVYDLFASMAKDLVVAADETDFWVTLQQFVDGRIVDWGVVTPDEVRHGANVDALEADEPLGQRVLSREDARNSIYPRIRDLATATR